MLATIAFVVFPDENYHPEIEIDLHIFSDLSEDIKKAGVIGFSVKDSIVQLDMNHSNLCSLWEVHSFDNGNSTAFCQGSAKCCDFVEFESHYSGWDDDVYIFEGKYGATKNSSISAMIIYVDYSLDSSNLYSDIYYSNKASVEFQLVKPHAYISELLAYLEENPSECYSSLLKFHAPFILDNEGSIAHALEVLGADKITALNIACGNITFTSTIKDSTGNDVEAIVEFYDMAGELEETIDFEVEEVLVTESGSTKKGKKLGAFQAASDKIKKVKTMPNVNLAKGKHKVVIKPSNHVIKDITIDDFIADSNVTEFIKFEELDISEHQELNNYVQAYAIDPTAMNFTTANVTVVATGTSLYKCKEWNFTEQECYGEWTLFKTGLVPGQEYTFELTPDDPGFGETISIFNVQSYPQVGGTWTVMFNTTGTANLTIKSVDGTTWSNEAETEDLKFLEVKCGDETLDYSWVNDSVFIEDYECNETGYEISKVISGGVHNLEFDFGGTKAYAHNFAGGTGFVWFDAPQDVTPGTVGSWQSINLSAYVPSGTTGVVIAHMSEDVSVDYSVGVRGLGDAAPICDATYCEMQDQTWRMQLVRVADNLTIEGFVENSAVKLKVMAYTIGNDPQFEDPIIELTSPNSGWQTIDVTAHVDADTDGVCLLVESRDNGDLDVQVRAVGSSNDQTAREWEEYQVSIWCVGIDANDQFQIDLEDETTVKFYLIAETKGSIHYFQNYAQITDPAINTWTNVDLDSYVTVPGGANGVFAWIANSDNAKGSTGLRNDSQTWNGQSGTVFQKLGADQQIILGSPIDESTNIFEHYVADLGIDFFIDSLTLFDAAPTIDIYVNDTDVEYGVESVLIDFNATDTNLDSVVANVTYPNGTLLQQLTDPATDFTFVPANLTLIGRYNITVFANDTLGSTNTVTDYFFYVNDTTAPTINISVNDTDVKYGVESVLIDFNASDTFLDSVIANVTYPNGTLLQQLTDQAIDFVFVPANLTDIGWYNITVFANDTSGNTNTSTDYSFYVNDTTAPTINISVNDTDVECGIESVLIDFNASDSFLDSVIANVTYPNGTLLQQLTDQGVDFEFEPANLTALGRYNITVFANDTSGNTNTTASFFYVNDTVAPTIDIYVNDTDVEFDVESVLIDFNASNVFLDSVIANVTYPNGTLLQQLTNQSVDFVFESSNLTALGRYNITVFANDTSGNTNTTTSFFYVNDTAAPTINISVNDTDVEYGHESVLIDFNASNGFLDSVIANVTYPNGTLLQQLTDHNVDFTLGPDDLTVLGRYNITVFANDTSGNTNTSESFFYVNDTITPPTWDQTPTNQTIEYSTSFSYDINASDNYAVDKYFIDDNTNFTINTASGLITNNTQLNLTTYTLNISVNDTLNHINSSVINITVEDTTHPTIDISINDTGLLFGNESVTIDFNASDYFLDAVIANVTYPNGTLLQQLTNQSEDFLFTPDNLTETGTYDLTVFANDTNGNSNTASTSFDVTTEEEALIGKANILYITYKLIPAEREPIYIPVKEWPPVEKPPEEVEEEKPVEVIVPEKVSPIVSVAPPVERPSILVPLGFTILEALFLFIALGWFIWKNKRKYYDK